MVFGFEEKLNVASPYVVMPLSGATGIVLDGKTKPSLVKNLQKTGMDVFDS